MQEKTIKELIQELKEQIKENQELIAEIKELNVDNEWWNNRYKAQVRINEEHQKINGELRKEIDGLEIVYGDLILKSTLSIGVSVFPQFAHDANELLDNAFIALQEAFHNGKNQVITSADIRS